MSKTEETQEITNESEETSQETSENLELTEDQKKNQELMDRLAQLEADEAKDEELVKKNLELEQKVEALEKKKLITKLLSSNKITKDMKEWAEGLNIEQLEQFEKKCPKKQTIKDIKNDVQDEKKKDEELGVKRLPKTYINDPFKSGTCAGFNIRSN